MANRAQSFNARALYHLGVPPLETGLDGRGVAIGFVDYGFDILHPCFRDLASGRSRFRYLWDQNSGREFDGDEIGEVLRRRNPRFLNLNTSLLRNMHGIDEIDSFTQNRS